MAKKDFHHPFQPYEIQQQFMEALYDCIEDGKVGIFESPTGTGKSLSLICGSLTWLREHKRKTFDDALATIVIDNDDPEWMLEHARAAKRQEMQQTRAEMEERLATIREEERKIKERHANGEPALKRRKPDVDDASIGKMDEEQFVLDDYDSDVEARTAKTAGNVHSAERTKLMEELGIIQPQRAKDAEEKYDEMKVYFCSRTHSQLSQFVGELGRVRLPPGVPPDPNASIDDTVQVIEHLKQISLGSRKNLCINPKVSKIGDQTAMNERCMELQQSSMGKEHKCRFLPSRENEDVVLDFRDHALAKLRDIEDLAKLGTKLGVCPYYASRPAIGPAEIVTLPYPLLLQRSARDALGISLKGHVVIIDEAHNLMNAVEGIYSTQISEAQLKHSKEGLIVYLQKFRTRLKGSNRVYVAQTVRVIDSLLLAMANLSGKTEKSGKIESTQLLAGKGVDQVNLSKLVTYISESKLARKVEGYVSHLAGFEAEKVKAKPAKKRIVDQTQTLKPPTLTSVQNFLMALMNPSKSGRFFWASDQEAENTCTIRYMLLDPSEHFRDVVEEARAVILAGGTMSPMEDYAHQLLPYLPAADLRTFSCSHLIPKSSLLVRTITFDAEGRLDFSFKARSLASTADRVGQILLTIAPQVREGMVIFFPSYGFLEQMMAHWRAPGGLLSRLGGVKPVFSDKRTASAEDIFAAYSSAITSSPNTGAILLSVLGGKLSEGINFSDALGRCVVVVGLPFPNLETPEWKAKLSYLDSNPRSGGAGVGMTGRAHAENLCMRSVNQAIGRVIRHKGDWAAIVLVDGRYGERRIREKLPGWIREGRFEGGRGPRGWGVQEVGRDLSEFMVGKAEV